MNWRSTRDHDRLHRGAEKAWHWEPEGKRKVGGGFGEGGDREKGGGGGSGLLSEGDGHAAPLDRGYAVHGNVGSIALQYKARTYR